MQNEAICCDCDSEASGLVGARQLTLFNASAGRGGVLPATSELFMDASSAVSQRKALKRGGAARRLYLCSYPCVVLYRREGRYNFT